ncbi:MAG: NADPH-dependent assimilatory sulfite reductase hemoprotein subunit [Phycisphaerae bacterium]|jgi:sulfite reductase beta subunit-like hemoprotein
MADPKEKKESKVEVAKGQSKHLRGTLAETLASDTTHFGKDDIQLLKFHGIYQQDDRDVRHERRKAKQEEAYQFMIRCAIPGGVLTAEQYLNLDEIADEYANGSLRATTRQGFQFHGVLKKDLKATLAKINQKLITTLSACGDVERNVMACPAPLPDEEHALLRKVARTIAEKLRPATGAYHEIWLDGEKQVSTQDEEPFYGDRYLPRKFKTGIALSYDNCVDVYTHDLGFVAVVDQARLIGFNVLVGGGLGMTHGKADTFGQMAEPLGFIAPEHAVETARTVAGIFRDFGNRADRRHARLKYVVAERGIEWMREEFRGRVDFELADWRPTPRASCGDHLGLHPQDNGTKFYGVYIENGRIVDRDSHRIRTALRDFIRAHRPGVTITPHQNILLTGLDEAAAEQVERTLTDHGVTPPAQLSGARRYSMACPALPTCGLAMSESERVMPSVVDRFEKELEALGVKDEPIAIRMTGCPNGCARPYTADIALVGRRVDVYQVYVGGGLHGDNVTDLYAADVATDDIIPTLRPLLASWAKHRNPGEPLGDYYRRTLARDEPRRRVTGKENPTKDEFEAKLPS